MSWETESNEDDGEGDDRSLSDERPAPADGVCEEATERTTDGPADCGDDIDVAAPGGYLD